MTKQKIPLISVVICSFNGGKHIQKCLKSLAEQTYPKKLYEVIVVDDGSTDNTGQIAKEQGANVIRHEINLGIPVARNAGFVAAKGEIIAYIDDDCVADSQWLEKLIQPFNDSSIIAAGGKILPLKINRFAERYMAAVGYGNPAPLEFGQSKNPIWRFWIYLKSMFRPIADIKEPTEVQAVFTANVAYRTSALKGIGGFDTTLLSDEDIDASSRLRKAGGRIMFIPDAIVRHCHHERLSKFIKQTYVRGENTLRYYSKEKKVPPLFPLPFLYVGLIIACGIIRPVAGVAIILFGPFILYSWWITRAIGTNSFEYLMYGYIQITLEISAILGLIRGFLKRRSPVELEEAPVQQEPLIFTIRHILTTTFAATVVVNLAVLYRYAVPFVTTPIILLGMLFIPGFLLALLFKIKLQSRSDFATYAFGLGLAFWIFGGLAVNWIFPLMGISAPLRLAPLLLFFNDSIAIMAVWVWFKNSTTQWTITRTSFNVAERWLTFVAPILLVMSLVGSEILNNLGSGAMTFAMIAGIGIYIFALAIIKKPVRDGIYAWSMWCLGSALLLMYSMRSWHLLGWDINAEYQVFQLALQKGLWNIGTSASAYNACLSITILPTILANFLPISPEYIFKLIMQLLFGMMPVMVFLLSRRFISKVGAALAGFIFMSQLWFYEQMTALIRQEIAFLFLGIALLVIFDALLSRRRQVILFLIASCGLILSHYSTAYVWLAMFFLTLIFSTLARFFIPTLKASPKKFTWILFLISLICIFCWEAVVTQSGNNFTKFAKSSIGDVEQAFSPNVIEDGISQIFFSAPNTNTDENLKQEMVITTTAFQAEGGLYPSSTYSNYNPKVINGDLIWPSLVPSSVSNFVLLISKISKFLVIDVFALLGTLFLAWKAWRRQKTIHHEYIAFCLASFPLIFLMIFLPILSVNYNLTRLFMQIFIVLSAMAIMGGLTFFSFLPRWRIIILALLTVILFFYSIGFTARFFGGLAHVTLNEPNGTFDNYYVYDGEVYSAQWLKANYNGQSLVYADALATLRLRSYALMNTDFTTIFPAIITRDSYVYMSYDNIHRGAAYVEYNNNLINYSYPIQFLGNNKNLIYNDGDSEIFK